MISNWLDLYSSCTRTARNEWRLTYGLDKDYYSTGQHELKFPWNSWNNRANFIDNLSNTYLLYTHNILLKIGCSVSLVWGKYPLKNRQSLEKAIYQSLLPSFITLLHHLAFILCVFTFEYEEPYLSLGKFNKWTSMRLTSGQHITDGFRI